MALNAGAFPVSTAKGYKIIPALSTSITIGAAGTYTSLTGAGGFFAALNAGTLIGNTTVTIVDASVTETGANSLNAFLSSCGGPYTLTIKPGVIATLTGSLASAALIKLNGADNVIIDGSTSGGTDRSLTISNTSISGTAISLISLGTGLGATSNTIKNCNISTGVATSICYGISVGGSTVGTGGADNDNVTIQNNSFTNAPIAIYANGTASVSAGGDDNLLIVGNTIDYNSTLAGIGIQVANALNSSITLNNITEQTTAIQSPTCISLETGFVSSSVTRNNITKSLTTSTSGYGGRGITVGTGTAASNLTIANNFISGVNGSNFSSFTNSSSMGIAIGTIGSSSTLTTTAGGINLYYNAVDMYGTYSTSTSNCITAALYVGSAASSLDIRNNILVNSLSNITGTGAKAYAIYSAAANTAFSNINYNDYFVSGSQGVLGFLTSDRVDLPGIIAGFGGNVNSQNVTPAWVSNSDLHIPAATNTTLESGGTVVSVTNDIDNDTRPGPAGSVNGGATAPDIGADEFDGVPASPMTFISCTTTQNNVTPIPTSTVNQEIIGIQIVTTGVINPLNVTSFTANTNGTTNTADIANAKLWYTGTSSTFAITTPFGSAIPLPSGAMNFAGSQQLLAGTNYFWLTYDVPCAGTLGNLVDAECNSLTVGSPRIPTTIAPAGSRTIQFGPLSGNYTVGTGGSYTTLNAAITDINTKGLNGNTTLTLLENLTLSAPLIINQWTECGGGGYTLKISPAAGTAVTVTGTTGATLSGIIKLNGADRVTIDGLNTGGASLTLENSSATSGTAVIWIASTGAAAGANNNVIRNCTIKAGIAQNASALVTYGIVMAGSTALSATPSSVTAGNDNDNNTITANTIIKARYGIYTMGGATTNPNLGTIISNNIVGPSSFGADEIGKGGILIREEDGIQITSNTIQFVGGDFANTSAGADRVGITIGTDASWTPTAVYVKNAIIANNKIHDVVEERTFSAAGIALGSVDGTNATNNVVVNNMLFNIKANGTLGDQAVGIGLTSGKGDGVIFNTVYLTGDTDPNVGASTPSVSNFGISISSTSVVNPSIVDNIVYMDLTSSSAPTLKNADINVPASFAWGTGLSNFNDLYYNNGNAESNTGCTGGSGGTFYVTLNNWQTAVSQDAMSVAILPVFISPTDVHLDISNSTLDNLGTPIPGVTTDIDNQTRSVTTPDMGADEFSAVTCVTAMGGTATVTGPSTFCNSGVPVITASGYSIGVGSTYQWMTSTLLSDYPATGTVVGGQTNPASLSTGAVTQSRYYWLKVTCGTNSSTDYSNSVLITIISATAAISGPSLRCADDPATMLNETGGTALSWMWSNAATTQSIMVSPTITTTYTVTVTGSGGCTATASKTIIVNPSPVGVTATVSANPICEGSSFNLFSTPSTGAVVVFNEGFESGAAGWLMQDSSSTGSSLPTQIFHIENAPYTNTTGTSTFLNFSITGAKFILSDADAGGSGSQTRTNLVSPSFSTVGLTSGTLSFKHGYRYWSSSAPPEKVQAQISSDGGTTWANLAEYQGTDVGNTTNDMQTTVLASIPIPGPYLGLPAVKVRFRYRTNWGYYWVIDDVQVSGNSANSFAWSSSPAGFTSSLQNPTGVTEVVSTNYTVTVTNGVGCSGSASTGVVNINPLPTITLGANPSTCIGTTMANLTYSATTGTPNQYSINYDAAAEAQGFIDVNNVALPSSPIVLTVPGAPALGMYNGSLTVRNSTSTCSSTSYPITVTIVALPNAGTVSGTSPLCVGTMTTYTSTGDPGGMWSSTSPSVATVNASTGVVTAVATGTTDITYTVSNGGACNPVSSFQTLTVSPSIVMNNGDSGAGSLRDVIACVGDGATIMIDGGLSGQTILLTSGEILIDKNITIIGLGVANLSLSGNNASRIFHVQTGKTLELHDMKLKDATSLTNGGAIFVEGMLKLQNMLLQNNFENGTPKALTLANPSMLDIIGGNVEFKN